MLSAANEKHCSSAQLNQKVFKACAKTHAQTSHQLVFGQEVCDGNPTVWLQGLTPPEKSNSHLDHSHCSILAPLLSSSRRRVCVYVVCICVYENRRHGRMKKKGRRIKVGVKLIYPPLIMVSWHQTYTTLDLFSGAGQLEKFFSVSVEETARYMLLFKKRYGNKKLALQGRKVLCAVLGNGEIQRDK